MSCEELVQLFFERLGYRVERIPEADVQSPDFLILDANSSYLLELKTKIPSCEQALERRKTLEEGEFYQLNEPLIRMNRLSGIIRKAQAQLRERKHHENVLGLIWLGAIGHLAEPRMHQFEATLYGSATIVDWATRGRSGVCYFFYNSDFFRYRDVLDAAIVSANSQARLLLNPLSGHYEQMRNSSLPKYLGDAVVDPIVLEAQGKGFIVEANVDRRSEATVLAYLRTKYKSPGIQRITMNHMSGTMAVSFEKDEA